MVKYTEEQILSLVISRYEGKKVYILAPLVRNRKGHYKELFEQVRKKGYLYVRVDGELREILHGMKLDRYKNHSVEVVVDKLIVSSNDERRLKESVRTAMKQGEGLIMMLDVETGEVRHYSRMLMDPQTGLSYSEPAPHNFSFNSPQGACPNCKGLGVVNVIDREKIMPDMGLSIYQGGIVPLVSIRNRSSLPRSRRSAKNTVYRLKTPLRDIPDDALHDILNGTDERLVLKDVSIGTLNYFHRFEGLIKYIEMQQQADFVGLCPEVGRTVRYHRYLSAVQRAAVEPGGSPFSVGRSQHCAVGADGYPLAVSMARWAGTSVILQAIDCRCRDIERDSQPVAFPDKMSGWSISP